MLFRKKICYWGIVVDFWIYVGPIVILCLYQIRPPHPLPASLPFFFLLICISITLSEPTPTRVYPFHWFFTFLLSFLFSFLPLHPKMSSYQQEHLKPNNSSQNPEVSTKIWCCVIGFFNKVFFEFVLDSSVVFFSFFFSSPIYFLNFVLFLSLFHYFFFQDLWYGILKVISSFWSDLWPWSSDLRCGCGVWIFEM